MINPLYLSMAVSAKNLIQDENGIGTIKFIIDTLEIFNKWINETLYELNKFAAENRHALLPLYDMIIYVVAQFVKNQFQA